MQAYHQSSDIVIKLQHQNDARIIYRINNNQTLGISINRTLKATEAEMRRGAKTAGRNMVNNNPRINYSSGDFCRAGDGGEKHFCMSATRPVKFILERSQRQLGDGPKRKYNHRRRRLVVRAFRSAAHLLLSKLSPQISFSRATARIFGIRIGVCS